MGELRVPEECQQLSAPTSRRRTFGDLDKFVGDMAKTFWKTSSAAVVASGAAVGSFWGHLGHHCTFGDTHRCNGNAAGQISSDAGYATFNCINIGWDCDW